MGKKYLAEVLSNDLITIYDKPRRYLALRLLDFSEASAQLKGPEYQEFSIVGARTRDYDCAVGSKLLVECSEDEQGCLQLGRIKVLDENCPI